MIKNRGEKIMKAKNCRIIIAAVVIIGIVFSALAIQPRTDGTYYNAVIVPTDADSVYAQEIKSDAAAAAIQVSNFSEGRYKLTLNLSNRSKVQYEYKVTLTGYSSSLICDTSYTEISYGENYSSGNRNNARTVYYFVPDRKNSEIASAGELSFDLQRNDPTSDVGVAEIEIAVYSSYTHRRISTITQQLCFDLVS